MTRSLSAAAIAELSKDGVRTCHLLEIDLPTPQHLTDNAFDIDFGGDTYDANGYLLSIESTKESTDLRVGSMEIELTAVDRLFIALFLTGNWINRDVRIRRAMLNESGQIIDTFVIFDGQITEYEINEQDDSAKMALSVASHWADFERTNGRRTNNNSQQFYFSGDLGFQYAANSIRDLKWGKA